MPTFLLGLRAQSHLDFGFSPHYQAFGTKLDRADFYQQLQKVRDGYAYPPAVNHQKDDGEASDTRKKAKSYFREPTYLSSQKFATVRSKILELGKFTLLSMQTLVLNRFYSDM